MSRVNPITIEVINEALVTIVREMRGTVFRTARSVAIYEAKDFSCGIFNDKAEVLAQSEDIGGHIIPLPWHVRAAKQHFGDDIFAGDVLMLNDPYCGGTHLNDVSIIYPVFHRNELVFFAGVREHWSDVGGSVPGSLSGSSKDIYQEGVRIPPIKVVDRGRVNKAAADLLFENMRVKNERRGDFESGISACVTAERRLGALIEKVGLDVLRETTAANIARSEQRMRNRIAQLPDGDYFYEDYLENFIDGELEPLYLPIRLSVRGDQIEADFSGASAQVSAPVNTTYAVTMGGVIIALKSILDPEIPTNHGIFSPITVTAAQGSIVNVQEPAPVGSHGEVRKRVMGVVAGALAQAIPDLVVADTHRTSFHNMLGGRRPLESGDFVHYEWGSGGNGAFAGGDGDSAMGAVDWGGLFTVQSTEVLESKFPIRIEACRLATDSGGPGQNRGGLGLERELRILGDSARYSLLADGAIIPAYGINGGFGGAPIDARVDRSGKQLRFDTPGKVGGFELQKGDLLSIRAAGGGGYGHPRLRNQSLVLDDVEQGYVSCEAAREFYGVVISETMELDAEATASIRSSASSEGLKLRVDDKFADEADVFESSKHSKRRVCRLHPADMETLRVAENELVELWGAIGAPLRAWCRATEKAAPGRLQLDRLAKSALLRGTESYVLVRRLRAIQAKGA